MLASVASLPALHRTLTPHCKQNVDKVVSRLVSLKSLCDSCLTRGTAADCGQLYCRDMTIMMRVYVRPIPYAHGGTRSVKGHRLRSDCCRVLAVTTRDG